MSISKIKKYSLGNTPLMIVIVVVIVIAILALVYMFWGKNFMNNSSSLGSPTPATVIVPTVNPFATVTPTPKATKPPTATPVKTPTPTPTPASQQITLNSNGTLDGFRASNNGGNNALEIRAGRNSTLIERGFVSFDVPSTLNGKTIETATLRLFQRTIIGTPYTDLGSLVVDHLDYGNSLDGADYSASSLSASFGTLTNNAVQEWKDLNVKDMLKDDLTNSRQRSQYRI